MKMFNFKKKITKQQEAYIVMLIGIYQKYRTYVIELKADTKTATEDNKKIYIDGMLDVMGKIKGACEIIGLVAKFQNESNMVFVYDSKDNLVIK